MDSPKVVPIRFVDTQGNPLPGPTKDPLASIPVMDVFLTSPDGSKANRIHCVALVDTGADTCIVPKHLVEKVGAIRGEEVQQNTASGSSRIYLAKTVIFFPSFLCDFTTDVSAVDYVGSPAYQMVIGRTFLHHGRLVMDYPKGVFEWHAP